MLKNIQACGQKGNNMEEKIREALKGICENLTDEQKEKAKACKNADEFIKLAGEWGMELPDEVLDAVAGGVQASDVFQRVYHDYVRPVIDQVYYF